MMNPDPQAVRAAAEAGTEQLIIDGCKITVRYSPHNDPDCVDAIKSLLLSAQMETK